MFLPDVDHLIYVLFMNPQDLTSQRAGFLFNHREIVRMVQLLYETRSERKGLVFHTIFFQIIFLILTFWVVTSSTSIFGKGLVLSFSLHLCVDQLVDMVDMGNLGNWLRLLPFSLDLRQSKIYLSLVTLFVCVLGFLM